MSEEPGRMHVDPDLDAELRATLEAARADRVDDERIERLALRLGPLLGPPGGGGGGGGGGPAKAAATAIAAKGGGVIAAAKGLALVAALGAAGTFVWIERGPSGSEPPHETAPHETAQTTERPSAPASRPEATPTTEASSEPPPASEPSTRERLEATRGSAQRSPRGVRTVHEEPRQQPAEPAPTSTTSPPSTPPPTAAVADAPMEISLVRGAMSTLESSPASALAQADEHARLYPHGALADDREVIAIDALVRLGRRGDAEERARRFRTDHPGSPSIRRIDRILAR
jgi:hypothetical protein